MVFNKNIKLFVICVVSYLAVCIQARSISQSGDVYIEKSDDKWICDHIECPLDSDRCFVSKSNEENPSVLKRVNICFSKNNEILKEQESSTPINPRHEVREYMNSYHGGTMLSSGDASIRNLDEKTYREYMDREMKKLHENLEKMNENIRKNIQHNVHNLHKNLSKMNYDLAHMFDKSSEEYYDD